MAGTAPAGLLDTQDFGQVPGTGPSNREVLSDILVTVENNDTPLLSVIGTVDDVIGSRYEWTEESIRHPKTTTGMTTTSLVTGAVEGADFGADTMTLPVRKANYVQEFRSDFIVSRRQQVIASKRGTAGIRDVIAHEGRKVMQELLRAVEARMLSTRSSAGVATGDTLKMKTLDNESTAPTETGMLVDYGGNIIDMQSGGAAVAPSESQIRGVIRAVHELGGRTTDVFVNLAWKERISTTFVGYGAAAAPLNRNADQNTVVATFDFYKTQSGTARIVGSIWVPGASEIETNSDTPDILSGRIYILQRDLLKIGWLDPLHTEVMGKRGTSIAAVVTGLATMKVSSGKQGKIKSVADV
jgi:hypothetical protein